MKKYDVAIIGGGILGTTISYWLSALYDLKICIVEKESDVALHSSTRNSGVIHYPFYLNPKQKKNFAKAAFAWDQQKVDGSDMLEGMYKIVAEGLDPENNKVKRSIVINLIK